MRTNNGSKEPEKERLPGIGLFKLIYPGVGIKRWLLVGAIGIALLSVGGAFLLRRLFDLRPPAFFPYYLEGSILAAIGILTVLFAIYGLYRSLGPVLFDSASINSLADTIYTRRSRGRGPRIVAVGGGTGLSVLLRGLKAYTDNLSAIVTVGDDGGSSGRLRRELGVLPPGDFRNCIVAMSDSEPLVAELFQYRFDQGEGLEGHSFGNLFIAAMTNVTGSFERALYESSRVLAVHGQVLPASLDSLRLSAEMSDGTVIRGESSITETGGSIRRVTIEPEDADAYAPALEAIADAQLIVIGPGSLYTSILPDLLVKDVATAIAKSDAITIYVCNVATEKGETDGYSVADHVAALQAHTMPEIVDYVVANDLPRDLGDRFHGEPVVDDGRRLPHVTFMPADLTDPEHPVRHDSTKLAQAILEVYEGNRKSGSPVRGARRAIARSL